MFQRILNCKLVFCTKSKCQKSKFHVKKFCNLVCNCRKIQTSKRKKCLEKAETILFWTKTECTVSFLLLIQNNSKVRFAKYILLKCYYIYAKIHLHFCKTNLIKIQFLREEFFWVSNILKHSWRWVKKSKNYKISFTQYQLVRLKIWL